MIRINLSRDRCSKLLIDVRRPQFRDWIVVLFESFQYDYSLGKTVLCDCSQLTGISTPKIRTTTQLNGSALNISSIFVRKLFIATQPDDATMMVRNIPNFILHFFSQNTKCVFLGEELCCNVFRPTNYARSINKNTPEKTLIEHHSTDLCIRILHGTSISKLHEVYVLCETRKIFNSIR